MNRTAEEIEGILAHSDPWNELLVKFAGIRFYNDGQQN